MHRKVLISGAVALAALSSVGCAADRDVEVSGSVAAPASENVSGQITLDFLDVVNDTDVPKSVATTKLDALGEFKQSVSVSGDQVRVRALVDNDGNGACSAGELWAETDATIKDDDTVDPVTLTLGHEACPAAN